MKNNWIKILIVSIILALFGGILLEIGLKSIGSILIVISVFLAVMSPLIAHNLDE